VQTTTVETFGPGTLAINPTPSGSKEKVSNIAWLFRGFFRRIGSQILRDLGPDFS